MMTNSAGLSGAKPTMMLTTPRLMSSCVVVSLSHFTRLSFLRCFALEGALPEEALHKGAEV